MAHVNNLNNNGTNGVLTPVQWDLLGSNGSSPVRNGSSPEIVTGKWTPVPAYATEAAIKAEPYFGAGATEQFSFADKVFNRINRAWLFENVFTAGKPTPIPLAKEEKFWVWFVTILASLALLAGWLLAGALVGILLIFGVIVVMALAYFALSGIAGFFGWGRS
jgi:hypothetical protein